MAAPRDPTAITAASKRAAAESTSRLRKYTMLTGVPRRQRESTKGMAAPNGSSRDLLPTLTTSPRFRHFQHASGRMWLRETVAVVGGALA
jgi:hypothetical protein